MGYAAEILRFNAAALLSCMPGKYQSQLECFTEMTIKVAAIVAVAVAVTNQPNQITSMNEWLQIQSGQ